MIDDRTEEVLALARQEIAARVEARKAERERGWRIAFVAMFSVLMLALLFWPGTPALHEKMFAVVHGVCAQEHTVEVGGLIFPLCARNTGIYSSFLITTGYLWVLGRGRAGKAPPWPIVGILVAFVAIMGFDGFNSLFKDLGLPYLYEPMNWLRTLTGIGMGVSIAVLLLLIFNIALRGNADEQQRVLKNGFELAGALVLALLMMAVMYGGLSFLFWPAAFIAWFGIIGVLFVEFLLVSSLVAGLSGRVTRLTQLAAPATIALVLTSITLGLMSVLRYWMEAQGMIS